MFDRQDDFKYMDVSRIRVAGLKLLPEREKAGMRAPTAKDVAFYREAVLERSRIRTDDEGFVKVPVITRLTSAGPGADWEYWDDFTKAKIANILGREDTIADRIQERWWHYAGIDRSADGSVVDNEDFEDTIADAVRGSEPARVHVPRNHASKGALYYPMPNPLVWLQDEFYAVKQADATGLGVPRYRTDGYHTIRWTTTVKTLDKETGEWDSETTTGTYTTTAAWYQRQVIKTDSRETDDEQVLVGSSGDLVVTYPCKCPDRVVSATFFFHASGQRAVDNSIVELKDQVHVHEAEPSTADGDDETVAFRIPLSVIAGFGAGLDRSLPGSSANGQRSVSISMLDSVQLALAKFDLRTGLRDVNWDYEPDDSITMP